jgi:uncharacterized protein
MRTRPAQIVLAIVLGTAIAVPSIDMSAAQERRTPTLFDMLFKRAPDAPPQTKRPRVSKKSKARAARPQRKSAKKRASEPIVARTRSGTRRLSLANAPVAPLEPAIVEKVAEAKVVLVVGDFIAGGLAEGLTDAFAQLPGVRVVARTNGSSGFVREDFYNWSTEIGSIVDTEKPVAVIMMIGSNDRQKMLVDGQKVDIRSENWDKQYAARTAAFATAVKTKNIPLYWVGMPPFRSRSMATDMLALNDEYRRAAESVSGTFVDIWDGFVDAEGNFLTRGPDVNGQDSQLRSNDGINMTRDGKRKMAFYVEKDLKKVLGTALDPNVGTLTKDNLPVLSLNPIGAPAAGTVMAPVSLADPELDGGKELLGAGVSAGTYGLVRSPLETLTIDGIAPDPQPGRANDFSWPPKDLPKPEAVQP